MRRGWVLALTGALATTGMACVPPGMASAAPVAAASTSTTIPASPAAGILASAIAATTSSSGFALEEELIRGHKLVSVLSGRIGRSEGVATLTEQIGGQPVQMTVLEVGGQLYISGNLFVLEDVLGIRASIARKLVHRWLRSPQGGAGSISVSGGFTVSSVAGILDLVGALEVLPAPRVGGSPVAAIRGGRSTPAGTVVETVYVRSQAPTYPVAIDESLGGGRVHAAFSHWGRQSIPQPVGAVDIKSSWLSQ